MLLEAHVPKQVYASPLVRAVIIAKWRSFALPKLKRQALYFGLYFLVFVVYQVSCPRCKWEGQVAKHAGWYVSAVADLRLLDGLPPGAAAGAGGADQ
jgi:hypothetical protein